MENENLEKSLIDSIKRLAGEIPAIDEDVIKIRNLCESYPEYLKIKDCLDTDIAGEIMNIAGKKLVDCLRYKKYNEAFRGWFRTNEGSKLDKLYDFSVDVYEICLNYCCEVFGTLKDAHPGDVFITLNKFVRTFLAKGLDKQEVFSTLSNLAVAMANLESELVEVDYGKMFKYERAIRELSKQNSVISAFYEEALQNAKLAVNRAIDSSREFNVSTPMTLLSTIGRIYADAKGNKKEISEKIVRDYLSVWPRESAYDDVQRESTFEIIRSIIAD
jgi:hypothetical protein